MAGSDRQSPKTKKTAGGQLLRWGMLLLAGLIAGLSLFHWNASVLAGNALPMPFGTGVAVVLSGSMSPTLEVNDLIVVREKDSYVVGDIVVFQSERDLVVHRMVAREGDSIITQGDANNVADDPIAESAIKGAVVARIPYAGAVVNVLKIPVVGILLLIGALVLTERSFQTKKQAEKEKLDGIKAEIRRLKEEMDPIAQTDADRKQGE